MGLHILGIEFNVIDVHLVQHLKPRYQRWRDQRSNQALLPAPGLALDRDFGTTGGGGPMSSTSRVSSSSSSSLSSGHVLEAPVGFGSLLSSGSELWWSLKQSQTARKVLLTGM